MSLTSLTAVAAASTSAESSGINHWVVGGGVLFIFLALMFGLLMFGAGRDHS